MVVLGDGLQSLALQKIDLLIVPMEVDGFPIGIFGISFGIFAFITDGLGGMIVRL